mmetsp:Transcript_7898/g.32066  ORF Transcript_7898/g.32066 Transcript_7898/m.32066 type:complete len:108 (-) Transcript_7898:520-843(-)
MPTRRQKENLVRIDRLRAQVAKLQSEKAALAEQLADAEVGVCADAGAGAKLRARVAVAFGGEPAAAIHFAARQLAALRCAHHWRMTVLRRKGAVEHSELGNAWQVVG